MSAVIFILVVTMTAIGIGAGIASYELRALERERPDLTAALLSATEDRRTAWENGRLEPSLPTWLASDTTNGWLGENRNTGSVPILPAMHLS